MNLVTCVQMVAGRMNQGNHFVMNVIMGNLQGEMELPTEVNVVRRIFTMQAIYLSFEYYVKGTVPC